MRTIHIQKEIQISAPADEVLPLACPVREYDWIEGWKCQLVNCPLGKNEEGVIFYERMSTPFLMGSTRGKTKWSTIVFDPENHKIHFEWANTYANALYKMEFQPESRNHTKLILDLTYKPKNGKGRLTYDDSFENRIGFMIEGLGIMLKHYCENNEMLSTKSSERKKEFVNTLSLREKMIFLIGTIRLRLSCDKNKKRYKKGESISVIKN